MRDYKQEFESRVAFIKKALADAHAAGVIYGNSGGKDCTLVGILCRAATENILSVIMPCGTAANFGSDRTDALAAAEKFGIPTVSVDLTSTKAQLITGIPEEIKLSASAMSNIAPRLRMTTLYAIGQSMNYLVAGTGNRNELYMGYFTKWGDGACDFNPIADLSVAEVYEFLAYLGAPESIIKKAPSAGLYEGQTDEGEMGVTYAEVDQYMTDGTGKLESVAIISRYHNNSEHKRRMPLKYGE